MKQAFTTYLLTGSLLLAAATTHAQTTFRIGPKLGYNRSFGGFEYPNQDYLKVTNSSRSGVEAGVVAHVGFSDHFAVQPAVLYAQKGFGFVEDAYDAPYNYTYKGEYSFHFNYLTVPVNLLYSSQPGGQGLQVFAGPYVGWLLGGAFTSSQTGRYASGGGPTNSNQGKVEAGDTYHNNPKEAYVSRGVDAGVQGGLGLGFAGGIQVQASYSQGLRNLGAKYESGLSTRTPPTYRNHAFQISLSYLWGPKS
ncbi:PorT family protein [Hymenobacter sp. BT683]|uniref:PorT family protein n=1 Tax=Hymenobacter jeongseonensis TaxID=2791027 RepID=A0ABS0IMB3_9BACT|nr:porin family protein [Hymenobacter jeongseonensis]MBF9239500.1 PorT family protein [Hymenobacter jeongseonensis]